MEQNKELLLRYLCMALPYGLQVKTEGDDEPYTLLSVHPNKDIALIGIDIDGVYATSKIKIDTIKPYLRPISSMTDEEYKIYHELITGMFETGVLNNFEILLDFFNSHHFDYRDLIKKSLALEAPKGMYDTKR